MRDLNIEQVRVIMLNLAKVFHKICVDNHITYYMVGGTILGAIRHKGFIPWDDDMDFAVPRCDFEKLEAICRKQLPKPYKIVERSFGNHVQSYLKIEDTRTSVDDCVTQRFHNRMGINLDIFPLENCSLNLEQMKPYIRKKIFLDRLGLQLFAEFEKPTKFKYFVRFFSRIIFSWVTPSIWLKAYHKLENDVNKTGDEALISLSSRYRAKEIIPREYWGVPRLYDFEDTQFYGPEDADKYLRCLFGDYMQLPPVEQRAIHCEGYHMDEDAYLSQFS